MSLVKEAISQVPFKETISGGQIFESLRRKFDLSQNQVASLIGVTQSDISSLECGRVKGRYTLRFTLASAQALGEGVLFLEGVKSQKVFLLPPTRRANQFFLEETDSQKTASFDQTLGFILEGFSQDQENNLIYIDQVEKGSLGKRLKEFRGQRTQYELGLAQPTVWWIETGKTKNPQIRILKIIADDLNIEIEELIGLKEIYVHPKVRITDQILRDERIPLPERKNLEKLLDSLLRLPHLQLINHLI